ncbi:hypothetical protein PRIC2_008360 [Phytophthora ramorum]
MSALDINWQRPAAPDGLKPLQILLEWLSHNAAEYHASTDRSDLLGGLCMELNARGVKCDVDQIVDYISYLQELIHEAVTLKRDLPKDLKPFHDRLKEFLFKEGGGPVVHVKKKIHRRRSNRLSWLKISSSGGASAMEMLVEWLGSNYTAYAHATKRGEKGRMLEELVRVMQAAGHHECAVHPLRAKIDALQREVRGEKNRSTAYEQFGAVLEEIFTVGDAAEDEENLETNSQSLQVEDPRGEVDSTMEIVDTPDVENREISMADSSYGDVSPLLTSQATSKDQSPSFDAKRDDQIKQTEEKTSSGTSGRLSWMKPTLSGGPSAMDILVEWLQCNYATYTHSSKKGDKGKMLNKLLHRIEDAGHRGCALHGIRAKIDSLQRQAEGRMRPSAAFDQYSSALQKIFTGTDGVDHDERSGFSPQFTAEHVDDEESNDSDETMEEPIPESLLTEQVAFQTAENSFIHHTTNQTAELRRLCVELNERGVKCVLDDILRDFECLQDTLQDDSVMHQVLAQDLLQHRGRLLRLILVTKRDKDTKFVTRFSWLRPSSTGGVSAPDILVNWLEHNYVAYCCKTGKRTQMVTEVLQEIEVSGHPGRTISRVQSQIRRLQRIVSDKCRISASLAKYNARLREMMKNRIPTSDIPHKRTEEDSDTSTDSEVPDIAQVTEVDGEIVYRKRDAGRERAAGKGDQGLQTGSGAVRKLENSDPSTRVLWNEPSRSATNHLSAAYQQ